jgi:hypothetical protein
MDKVPVPGTITELDCTSTGMVHSTPREAMSRCQAFGRGLVSSNDVSGIATRTCTRLVYGYSLVRKVDAVYISWNSIAIS